MLNVILQLYILNEIQSKNKKTARKLKTLLGNFITDSTIGIRTIRTEDFHGQRKEIQI